MRRVDECWGADRAVDFAELYRGHRAFVRRSLRALRVPDAAIDDTLQEVFMVVHRSLDRFDAGRGTMRAWLYGVCLRVARNLRRRHARQRTVPMALADLTADPADYVAQIEAREVIDRLVPRLTPEQWGVFVMADIEGMTGPEIAETLGVGVNTAYTRLTRARARIGSIVSARQRAQERRGRWSPGAWLPWIEGLFGRRDLHLATAAFASVRTLAAVGIACALLLAAVLGWAVVRSTDAAIEDEVVEREDPGSFGRSRGEIGSGLPGWTPGAVGSIRGRVLDESEQGIANANVCAWPTVSFDRSRVRPTCVTSQSGGRYRLDRLVAGGYRVTASAPRRLPAALPTVRTDRIDVAPNRTQDGIDLHLRPGGVEIRGIVRDLTGGTVEGALVTAARAASPSARPTLAVFTDADGTFRGWIEPGSIEVRAHADGYAPDQRRSAAPGWEIELTLSPEAVIAGRVVDDATDRPIAGARVSVWRDLITPRARHGLVRTDADGRFRIEQLPPGHYKPVAQADGRFGVTPTAVTVGLGTTVLDVEVRVHPAASLHAVVVEQPGDRPCPYGRVELFHRELGGSEDRPLADGRAVFEAIPTGTYDAKVECGSRLSPVPFTDIVIGDPGRHDRVWELAAGIDVSGQVVDSSGVAVPGALVFAAPDSMTPPRGGAGEPAAVADQSGSFSLRGLQSGAHRLDARLHGYAPSDAVAVELAAGQAVEPIVLTLRSPGRVVGQVRDPDGKPIARVWVRLRPSGAAAESDAQGRFELSGIAPGRHSVEPDRDHWDAPAKPVVVDVDPGETREVTLTLTRRTGEIHGRVLDRDGQPIADAMIVARTEREGDRATLPQALRTLRFHASTLGVAAGADGRFVLSDLPHVPHTVLAYRRDAGETWARGVEPGASLRLVLDAQSGIGGRVTASDGAPAGVFKVFAYSIDNGFFREDWFQGETWHMDGLAPGRYELVASAASGWARTRASVEVGRTRRNVNLVLSGRVTLTGRLVDLEDGTPVVGYRVVAGGKDAAGYDLHSAVVRARAFALPNQTDATGRFELRAIPRGIVHLIVGRADSGDPPYASHFIEVEAAAGPVVDLGAVPMVRRRVAATEAAGALGFTVPPDPFCGTLDHAERSIGIFLEDVTPVLEQAGLHRGDEVVGIDGHDVSGRRCYLFEHLAKVPPETVLSLQLAGRSEPVRLTVAPPASRP